jgi:hypothetical protein
MDYASQVLTARGSVDKQSRQFPARQAGRFHAVHFLQEEDWNDSIKSQSALRSLTHFRVHGAFCHRLGSCPNYQPG